MTYVDEVARSIQRALPDADRPTSNALALYRLYALLALTRGTATSLKDVHDAWSVWMSTTRPEHPALRPFAELDMKTQAEDEPYVRAIRAVAAQLANEAEQVSA